MDPNNNRSWDQRAISLREVIVIIIITTIAIIVIIMWREKGNTMKQDTEQKMRESQFRTKK